MSTSQRIPGFLLIGLAVILVFPALSHAAGGSDYVLTADPIVIPTGEPTEITLSLVVFDPGDLPLGAILFCFSAEDGLEVLGFEWLIDLSDPDWLHVDELPCPQAVWSGLVAPEIPWGIRYPVARISVLASESGLHLLHTNVQVFHAYLLCELSPVSEVINVVAGPCPDPADDTPPTMSVRPVYELIPALPFAGFIDPRAESTDGQAFDLGIRNLWIEFSEPVVDLGSTVGGTETGALTSDALLISATGGEPPPGVEYFTFPTHREMLVRLDGPIAPQEWTTIRFDVEDLCGNPIENLGDLGPETDEPDRVDIGFLPCDIDQSGTVQPLDLLWFRQMFTGVRVPKLGGLRDYIDSDRSGTLNPADLLRFRQLLLGTPPATRPWVGETMNHPRP